MSRVYGPGAVLNNGRYKITKELNVGGTAIVYEAVDNKKNRKVALKVMNVTEKQFHTSMKLSKREVEFSNTIKHDNFVQLLDVFSGDRQLVLVWELIYGLDLLDLLNEHGGIMSEEMAAFYFHQLLKGVLFMHESGFCHRDLKAENCMVIKKTQQLKIIDFGLARHIEAAVTSTTGTPDYLAPELLTASRESRNDIDQRAIDVWAMGVILYLLVTGKYPFEDPANPNSFVEVFKNIAEVKMRPLPHTISQGLKDLLSLIFVLDPMKRITLKDMAKNRWLLENAKKHAYNIKKPSAFSPLMGNSTLSVNQRLILNGNTMQHKSELNDLPVIDQGDDDGGDALDSTRALVPQDINSTNIPNDYFNPESRYKKIWKKFKGIFYWKTYVDGLEQMGKCFYYRQSENRSPRQPDTNPSINVHTVSF